MPGLFRRRKLPHWDVDGATYFVTSCLEGSLSARGYAALARYRQELDERPAPAGIGKADWEVQRHKLLFARFDEWVDRWPAVKYLEDSRLAEEVRTSLYYFAGQRYHLLAYVVMPSHFHCVFRPLE